MDAIRHDFLMEHQTHFGKKFYKDHKAGYWISTACPKIRAHVWVWKYTNGNIPKGHEIHHKDGNKNNNDILNLECLNKKSHIAAHMSEERKSFLKKLMNEIRPLTKIWHASPQGIEWHSQHGKASWEKRELRIKNCQLCNKEFQTKLSHHRFCHANCKAKALRLRNKIKKAQETKV